MSGRDIIMGEYVGRKLSMSLRRNWLTRPIFNWARRALPTMSDTERDALEADDIWWDAELFTGNPDWSKLLDTPAPTLSPDEQAFLKGPVEQLCGQLDDWRINWEFRELPSEVWDFIKANRFFGMIIPKDYRGLGFSPFAHSEVIRKISTRSVTAAVTVMVPNSLGPGELLLRFGTKEQRDYWLPRLADGREIPCFGLTSPEAGSDAASMIDQGVICRGSHNGREVLGLRLSWHKRYITLAPVATVLGLAFKAYDPDHLIGNQENLGITVALVATNTPGVEIGRRHLPSYQVFENGPTCGHDVFVCRHWRAREAWARLKDADERPYRRSRHLPTGIVCRGCSLCCAKDRCVRAGARAIQYPDRQVRRHRRTARPYRRNRLPSRCGAPPYLRRPRSRSPPGGHLGHHEVAGNGTHAQCRQRCDGRTWGQGRDGAGFNAAGIWARSPARCAASGPPWRGSAARSRRRRGVPPAQPPSRLASNPTPTRN